MITDVIMPDKDGYEVCQHIKHHPLWQDPRHPDVWCGESSWGERSPSKQTSSFVSRFNPAI